MAADCLGRATQKYHCQEETHTATTDAIIPPLRNESRKLIMSEIFRWSFRNWAIDWEG